MLWERSSIYQHIYQVGKSSNCVQPLVVVAGSQQDDDGGVREADGELQGHPGRAATEANQADVLCRVKHRLVGFNVKHGNLQHDFCRTNECIFECKLCQPSRKFNSKNKISFHVKRMHGLKMTEYNQKYGSSLLSRSWHTCQICGIRY